MKVYTKTGDKGETSLFTGQRVSKDNACIEALGAVDECNCSLGVALSLLPKEKEFAPYREQLEIIQHALFDVGAALATPRTSATSNKVEKTRFDNHATELLEQWIDAMEEMLPGLKTFILPGGHPAGAALHLARSLARRAERRTIPLFSHAEVSQKVLIYMNRLSDYLFVLSRRINQLTGSAETRWEPHKTG